MNLKLLFLPGICLSLILLLTSCSRGLILHPLTDKDIYSGKEKGDVCFSEYYLKEVLKAKIEAK